MTFSDSRTILTCFRRIAYLEVAHAEATCPEVDSARAACSDLYQRKEMLHALDQTESSVVLVLGGYARRSS